MIPAAELYELADRANYSAAICTLVAGALSESGVDEVAYQHATALRGAAAMLDGLAHDIERAGERKAVVS
jgi:hypothetical protein